jgi:hypothetical protein
MATGGILGDGTKVAFSIGSPLAWQEVTQIIEVTGPGLTPDKVSNDLHGSVGFHRNMPGLKDVSDMVITVAEDLDPATSADHATLWGLLQQGTTVWWRKEIPTNRAKTTFVGFEFQGNVAGYEPSTPIDDRQTSQITVQFDGTALGMGASGASQI